MLEFFANINILMALLLTQMAQMRAFMLLLRALTPFLFASDSFAPGQSPQLRASNRLVHASKQLMSASEGLLS